MGRGAWRAAVHGVARVRHDLVTEPPGVTGELAFPPCCQTREDTTRVPCATRKVTHQNPNHVSGFPASRNVWKKISLVSKLANLLYIRTYKALGSLFLSEYARFVVPSWLHVCAFIFLGNTLLPLLHLMNDLLFKAHLKCYLLCEVPPKFSGWRYLLRWQGSTEMDCGSFCLYGCFFSQIMHSYRTSDIRENK